MQCENGYTKPGVRGILCRKAEEPKDGDMRSTAHALCGHQRFCPSARCYMMLPGWEKCTKRGCGREEAAESKIEQAADKPKARKKKARAGADKAQEGEEA